MTQPQLPAEALEQLKSTFLGHIMTPDQAGYEDARHVYNGMIDKHPALIARCHSAADIADALALARDRGLEVAVRGGGHNVAGRATTNGGLMIDLSAMKAIHVDPQARIARAQGGANWAEFNRATQVYGLATTGGVISSTGIAGLTLGGGHGWIMGKYGLAVDNLLAVEITTADGRTLRASADEHADLFWGVRGGGGNFGVVSWFEYQLHELSEVTGGMLAYPADQAGDVLRFYRDLTASSPDELTIHAGLLYTPDATPIVAVLVCHCGSSDQAASDLAKLKSYGSPVADTLGPMSYCALNAMLDDGFPHGARNYWKSSFLK
ncbi:MAG: FAD-dependent oxidoreductase, partial [Myxococcota bacterium]